jgi:hypothetical protein
MTHEDLGGAAAGSSEVQELGATATARVRKEEAEDGDGLKEMLGGRWGKPEAVGGVRVGIRSRVGSASDFSTASPARPSGARRVVGRPFLSITEERILTNFALIIIPTRAGNM